LQRKPISYKHIGINIYNFLTDEIYHEALSQIVYANTKFYNNLCPYVYQISGFLDSNYDELHNILALQR